jgi:hypothetical protein
LANSKKENQWERQCQWAGFEDDKLQAEFELHVHHLVLGMVILSGLRRMTLRMTPFGILDPVIFPLLH